MVCGLLSSCGVRVFSSLVGACRLQGTWGLSLCRAGSRARRLCSLWHVGSKLRCASSVVVARGLSCPTVCGILVP